MQNQNRVFQREMAKDRGLSMNEAGQLIADRAQKVAQIAGCHWGGQDKRGVLFFMSFSTGPNEIAAPTVFFSFETAIDEPSKVIEWAREQRRRYEVSPPVTLASGRILNHRRMANGAQEVIEDLSNAEWDEYCALIAERSRPVKRHSQARTCAAC